MPKATGRKKQGHGPSKGPAWAGFAGSNSGSVEPQGFLGLGATLADHVAAQKRVADGEDAKHVYLQKAPASHFHI